MPLKRDHVEQVMKTRGYESVSHNETGGQITVINFVKHLNDQITVYAKVSLNQECITLSFVELKYFCQLCCNHFSFEHPDFEKFEQTLMIYAAKCLDVDVFQVLALLPLKNVGVSVGANVGVKKPEKKDIKTRKRELWDKVVAEGKEKGYAKEMCLEFYNYWTEMNEGGKKLRFEMEKIFDIKRRLSTWLQHDKKWSKTFVDKKVEKQDKEVTKVKTVDTKDLF